MRTLRGYWRALVLALVVAGIAAMALWPETTEVDIVTLARGPLEVTIDEEGETRVRERFLVSAPVAGRLLRVELEPGDQVTRGKTVLARLVPAPPALLDARSQAELKAAAEAARAGARPGRGGTRPHPGGARARASRTQEAAGAVPGGADRA